MLTVTRRPGEKIILQTTDGEIEVLLHRIDGQQNWGRNRREAAIRRRSSGVSDFLHLIPAEWPESTNSRQR
jgi:hypothetical protein